LHLNYSLKEAVRETNEIKLLLQLFLIEN